MLKPDDDTSKIFIVENGLLEVYTVLEGNEFPIEFLGPGCVLNSRLIFTEDLQHLFVRAYVGTFYYEISQKDIEDIGVEHPDFGKRILLF